MPKAKQPRSKAQQQQVEQVKATFSAVGTSQAEKQAVQDALHPYKKNHFQP
jgi:hypothetical protein